MPESALLTDEAIGAIAAAVFEAPGAQVLEAHSDFDREPRSFQNEGELASYIRERIAKPRGSATVCVLYPDMAGRAARETIHLKPGSVASHSHRYIWQGWGLIFVFLERGDQPGTCSRVAANSVKRALKWAPTYPQMDPPETWNWKAVERHARRLQRVVRKYER